MKKNKILLIIILLIYLFIPILIFYNNYLYKFKFYILVSIGLIVYLLLKLFKVSNKELGITKNNLLKSIKRNIILIILCIIGIIIFKLFNLNKYNPTETICFYMFYIFISCPIQEFLYRGVFGYFDMNSKYNFIWLILSSLFYSFIHIIYRDYLTCIITFIIGIVWYLIYKKDYNLCGVVLSHIVLGILTITLGIIN